MRKSILLAGLLTLASAGFAQNKLTPELLWKLGRVGDAVLSPDGKTVAYTVRNFNLSENKGKQKIDLKTLSEEDQKKYAPEKLREDAIAYFAMIVEKYPQSRFKDEAEKTLKEIQSKK